MKKKSNTERASGFMCLNKIVFNGLFRVNRQNQINVPYRSYKHPVIVNEEILRAVSDYLIKANIQILNGDFEEALQNAKKGASIYFDPPYAPVTSDKQRFVGYTLDGFNAKEQQRLYRAFNDLT
ncbi:DNA adenine methylase [Lentilactobacillus parabuchneri]|nr:DNA adenine methylase [Lentilactobacillus parabuchneri]MDG9737828.1 DNA adenine methylase [Lentilactobacillus parabuchneri]